jgi:16S rRNA (uracil1498-N3)-methyltransferase
MARRRFFVDSVHSGHARIEGEDAHHLTRVLRVEPGQKFEISDNARVYLAEVETARKDLVSFAVLEPLEIAEPALHPILLASLIKFEHFEWMLEKATELGIERLIAVEAERTEKGVALAANKRLARWERIAREASEQSRRARLPEIKPPMDLTAALRTVADHRYVLEEQSAPAMLDALPPGRTREDRVALLVGPEGGWTDRERAAIAAAGWAPVSLGPLILRAETAAVAGLAILNAAWAAAKQV